MQAQPLLQDGPHAMPQGTPQHVGAGLLQQAFALLVRVSKTALAIERHKSLADAGQCGGQSIGQPNGFILCLLLCRNILYRAFDVQQLAGAVVHRVAQRSHPLGVRHRRQKLRLRLDHRPMAGAALELLAQLDARHGRKAVQQLV